MPDSRTPSTSPGRASPLGATLRRDGVNFSLYSRCASGVDLLLFDGPEAPRPARTVSLEPAANRSYHYWHVFIPGLRAGQHYAYRVHGPHEPARGLRCDPEKVLLDPYGRSVIVPAGYSREAACWPGDNCAVAMRSAIVDVEDYDWEGDVPLGRPASQTIVYELHVRGFTRNPNSGVAEGVRGTYAGLIEKIPYLKALNITAVELLPVFQFDAQDAPPGRTNVWGYAPVSFFAPHGAYSSQGGALGPLNEFRDMVKALHRAGIEVILDVVFNHTAEGDERGPTLCLRGVDNRTYYVLEQDPSRYANFSGTGNTLHPDDSVVRRMILDSLRYWVEVMHVDGFRFDLASILARDQSGRPLPNPPLLWDIESDPILAGTKLIAEAWDAAGLYQVGSFVGDSWREWNGRFRDDVRSFVRGDRGTIRPLAARLTGSPDLYDHKGREAEQSVNFVTCHDGFTLNDLVSYDRKHNEANGEGNRDGSDDNRSWNCGVEGPTTDPAIEALRERQIRNFFTLTLLSLGLPMFVMGDEVRRTQRGNNNAYCLDDETSWFDWSLLSRHAGLHRFVTLLNQRRVLRDLEDNHARLPLAELLHEAAFTWHGTALNQPDWSDDSHSIALQVDVPRDRATLFMILNAWHEALEFELPPAPPGVHWRRWIDTSRLSPEDISPWRDAPMHEGVRYRSGGRSVVVLFLADRPL
jgi:glycogen operon protein